MKQILKHILILAFAAGFIGTACENNDLNIDAGTFPETGGIGLSMYYKAIIMRWKTHR